MPKCRRGDFDELFQREVRIRLEVGHIDPLDDVTGGR